MTLGKMLEKTVQKYPHKKAIIFKKKKTTYKELNKKVNKIAHGLMELDIGRGDRVAILLPNCPEYITAYFAIAKIGGIVVPLNSFLIGKEYEFILNDCQVTTIFTSSKFIAVIKEILPRVKSLKHIIMTDEMEEGTIPLGEFSDHKPTTDIVRDIKAEDTAVIIYTSGTTGQPKGAMLSHLNLVSNAESTAEAIKVYQKDRFLLFLPMFHSFTYTACVILPIYSGARIIILETTNRQDIKKSVIWDRATIFVAVPPVYNMLCHAKVNWLTRRLNPIRVYVSGAAPLAVEVLKKFEGSFQIPLVEGYGLSETSPVVSLNPLEGTRKPGSVGIPIPKVEVKIVDENEKELPPNEVGELIVKGPNVMKGYYNRPQDTKETIKGEWLFTGDVAKIDEDGYIYIVERKKDLILVRGLNVYPREIEEILYTHPKVLEVAVIGVSDKHKGEIPKAFIALKEGEKATEAEMKEFCKKNMAPFKVPRYIEFKDSLPKTPTGKILKRELRSQ